MTTLSQREARNFQFDFLRPNHSLYQFFSRLVDQYTELLRYGSTDGEAGKAEKERMQELQKNVEDRFHLLGRAKQRAQWTKYQEQQKAKKEEEEGKGETYVFGVTRKEPGTNELYSDLRSDRLA